MKTKILTLIAVVFVILVSSTVVLAADITYDGVNYSEIDADNLTITVNYAASNYAEGEHVTLMVLTGSDTVTYTDGVPDNIAYVDQHEITADSGSFTFILAKDFITDNQVFVKLGSTTMASSDNTTATVITEGSVNFIDANGIVESFISGCDGNYAAANTDVVFTVNKGTLATNIQYKANGGNYVDLVPDGEGKYTIPGSAITGDIELKADVVGEGISVELTSNDDYKPAVTEMIEKQLCIIEGTSPSDSYTVDGVQLYWSPLYNGHVGFISDEKSLENLQINEVVVEEGVAPTQVVYNGDINGNGRATAADATIIKDCLLGKRTLPMTDMQLLKLDADGDRKVTTFDIVAILNKAVGK